MLSKSLSHKLGFQIAPFVEELNGAPVGGILVIVLPKEGVKEPPQCSVSWEGGEVMNLSNPNEIRAAIQTAASLLKAARNWQAELLDMATEQFGEEAVAKMAEISQAELQEALASL